MLKITNLCKSYSTPQGEMDVLKNLSLDIAAGEKVALVGESGCGKSTLLHVIAGLEPIQSGSVMVGTADIAALDETGRAALRREKLSLIFQQFNLITSMTVADNLSFEAKLAGRYDPAWTNELADRLDLSGMMQRYPEQLSGGQQQRLAIGRSFAARPSLILADEPTGNLDEVNSDIVLDIAFELVAQTGCTLVLATHSSRLAKRADRIVRLSAGRLS